MTIKEKLRAFGRRSARYALSLPERTVRSVSALTAGVVREVAEVTLPIGVRRGRLYKSLVEVTLRFLIEDVGGVAAAGGEQRLGEDFLLRRAAGNGIEWMGILAFRASPVWVLAALADACGFGRQLIPEIAKALQEEGLLGPAQSFATMDQLLDGLESTAGQLAESVNTPPLDVAALREDWSKLAAAARRLPAPMLPSPRAVAGVWADLRTQAAEQQRTVFEVSSLLALAAVSQLPERARVLSKSAAIAAGKSGAMVADALLEHYRTTLEEMRRAGYLAYGARQLAPYARAALAAFAPRSPTLTDRLVDGL